MIEWGNPCPVVNRLMGVAGVVAVLTAGCRDTAAPAPARRAIPITGIQVPAHGTTTDTVLVVFRAAASPCDTSIVTTAERRPDGIRFAASSMPADSRPCPLYPTALPTTVYAVLPPHALPLTFYFAEPNEPDSVRTVSP